RSENMSKKCIIAGILMLALVPFAGAQDDMDMELLLGAHAGYDTSIDEDEGDFVWGGILRIKPWDILGMEAMADVTEDDFLDETIDTENVTVMGNILFYPIPDIFYISAGAGWTRADIDYTNPLFDDETEDQFAWNAGAGIEIPILSWLSVYADARYVFRDLDLENDPAADDVNTDFWMVRGGLALRFGGDDNGWNY
ncbi:MAG: outer membrane protein, partial [Candidatus Latescibacterota bacterium]